MIAWQYSRALVRDVSQQRSRISLGTYGDMRRQLIHKLYWVMKGCALWKDLIFPR